MSVSVWQVYTRPNLLSAVKRPLIFVKAVSMLRARFPISADTVELLHTKISVAGGLIADGTVAAPIAGLWKRFTDLQYSTVHSVVSLLVVAKGSFISWLKRKNAWYIWYLIWTCIFSLFSLFLPSSGILSISSHTNTSAIAREKISFSLFWAVERRLQHLGSCCRLGNKALLWSNLIQLEATDCLVLGFWETVRKRVYWYSRCSPGLYSYTQRNQS